MIILIAGATHTGKTILAQKLLEKYRYPYLSIDHLKMGLIRSKQTTLKPTSKHQDLTNYLWPIILEIIKTNIENNQHIIIEGSYIPFDYKSAFNKDELSHIKILYLVFSKSYIDNNFNQIIDHANVIESRLDDDINCDHLIAVSAHHKLMCEKHKIDYIYIDNTYDISSAIKKLEDLL